MFSYQEAFDASLSYFNNDKLAADTFLKKYALRDKSGNLYEKTPDDMHTRLAKEFARMDKKLGGQFTEADYFEAMKNFKRIVPQGSPMQAVGNKFADISASNCFVINAEQFGDSISGIMYTIAEAAEIMKRRGGVGIDVSVYRPAETPVNNSAQASTGVASVSDALSYFGRYIGQRGRVGALMITIDDRHPDVMNFAKMKADLTKVTGANISVKISNDLLKAVECNGDWELKWPVKGPAQITKTVKAKDIWNIIVDQAWKTGEPGLLMWNNYCDNLPAHCYKKEGFETITTNPCSELGLSGHDSCRLISQNLLGYVDNPHTINAKFNFDKFMRDIRLAMYMEDNLVEIEIETVDRILSKLENDPDDKKLPYSVQKGLWTKIKDAAIKGRRTGLGTHGLADCLNALAIPYDKSDSIVDKIYSTFRDTAYRTSIELAKIRGPFPVFNWETEKDNKFIKRLPQDIQDDMAKYGRRNISLLTIAPTGSVALLSRTSSGIEPVYDYAYIRRVKITSNTELEVHFVDKTGDKWHNYVVIHPELQSWMKINKYDIERLQKSLLDNSKLENPKTTLEIIREQVDIPKSWYITATTLAPSDRLRIVGKIQSYIDHGVSQTCNFAKGTSKETVEQFYRDAAKHGLKGVTVYIDGSRDGVLVSSNSKAKRPKDIECNIHRSNGHIVLVGILDGKVHEVFAGEKKDLPLPDDLNKAVIRKLESRCYAVVFPITTHTHKTKFVEWPIRESFLKDDGMTVRLLTNLAIRNGVDLGELVETVFKSADMSSFSRHVARVLSNYVKNVKHDDCCDNPKVVYEDGCKKCTHCGHTKCN